ncbi:MULTISPECIES: helix-turn-helix domain-containing protein [unclassified Aeromicrobium]|uniref:PucR family transcriptional regulator n=1 Tax=unclassified Aeromicrobium TaxID=2633570 RepID=UPI00288991F4|nr:MULTISPECIES: helix-turn-helix domain-containing protein [unclassified Aeromicrobium]
MAELSSNSEDFHDDFRDFLNLIEPGLETLVVSDAAPHRRTDLQPVSADGRRLVERLLQRRHDLAELIVADVREGIVDYGALGELTMSRDVLETALLTVTDLLESLLDDEPPGSRQLRNIERSASRRVHQDVSLTALLQSYRIWGARIWQAVLDEAGDEPAMRDAALELVSRIFAYVDMVSITLAQVYTAESAGVHHARDVLRSDLLESLLLGQVLSDRVRVEMARLHLSSETKVAVVVLKPDSIPAERLRAEAKNIIHLLRSQMSRHAKVLFGVRDGDVICLVRIANEADRDSLHAVADAVATERGDCRVSVGRPHTGVAGIQRSFREAQEAAAVVTSARAHHGAVFFTDVILDRILVRSEYTEDLLNEALGPLIAYDAEHRADLLATLRSFVENDMNMTRTAKDLLVNPNTVAYRIKRIGALTGQDPTSSSGIVTLAVALRLMDG